VRKPISGGKLPPQNKGKTLDKVAKATGISARTLAKAGQVTRRRAPRGSLLRLGNGDTTKRGTLEEPRIKPGKRGEGKKGSSGGSVVVPPEEAPTYEALGIDKKVAARSQRRAKAGRQAHEARADQAVVKAKDVVNAAAVPRTAA
jgi:hypothetical protein